MPYIDLPDGSKHWKYDHQPDATGDPLRVAGEWLAYHVEAFLFDYNHPGFQKSEFLSWCLSHFDTLRAGTVPHSLMWDPTQAGNKPGRNPADGPRGFADIGIRYPDAAFQADHIDTSTAVPGVAEHYGPTEVPEPWMARYVNSEATVVPPRHVPGEVTGASNEEPSLAETIDDGTDGSAHPDQMTIFDLHLAKKGDA